MEIVRSLIRSWIYDTYFSKYRAIHPGESPGGNVRWWYVRISYDLSCRPTLLSLTVFARLSSLKLFNSRMKSDLANLLFDLSVTSKY